MSASAACRSSAADADSMSLPVTFSTWLSSSVTGIRAWLAASFSALSADSTSSSCLRRQPMYWPRPPVPLLDGFVMREASLWRSLLVRGR